MSRPTSNWLIELTRLSLELRKPKPIQESESRPKFSPAEKRQTVVGSGMPREPINREAAMLLSRSNDWLIDPNLFRSKTVTQEVTKKKKSKKGKHKMSRPGISETTFTQEGALPIGKHPRIPKNENPEDYFSIDDITAKVIAQINKQPQQLSSLARAGIDARNLLDENLKALGQGYEEFNARVKVCLEDLRQSRFAFVTETSQMLQPLKDIRQFLLGKDYEQEIARLKEFVDLCERLQVLKENGVLDAVADTMIKLAI